jgi:hypothetical protein
VSTVIYEVVRSPGGPDGSGRTRKKAQYFEWLQRTEGHVVHSVSKFDSDRLFSSACAIVTSAPSNCCRASCLMAMRAGWLMGMSGYARWQSQSAMAIA